MSLVRHAKSPFWYMSFMVSGKSIFRSTKTNNKALAQKIENETRKQMVEGIHFKKNEHISLQDIIKEFIDSRQGTKSLRKDEVYARKLLGFKTHNVTRKPVAVYGLDATMNFDELKTKDLFRLLSARKREGMSSSTIIQELLFINGLLKTAKQLGYMVPDINPCEFKKEHKLKTAKKAIRYLSADEETRLIAELEPKKDVKGWLPYSERTDEQRRQRQDTYDFVIALLDTGARYTEVSEIEWTQINLNQKMIRLVRGKVGNESTLYMTDRLYEVLLRRSLNKDSKQFVFTSKDGTARNYSPRALQTAIKNAGIKDCTFHTMRKTLASKLVRAGLSISDVSVILGHSTVATTQNYYASLSPAESSKRAVALLNV